MTLGISGFSSDTEFGNLHSSQQEKTEETKHQWQGKVLPWK